MADGQVEYDLVTIGAGSGGVRASRVCAGVYGAKVAVVELPFGFVSSDTVGGAGGTCVIRGCVPKKLLVYASEFADSYRDAQGFGWGAAQPPVDVRALIQRKAKEIERLNGIYSTILSKAGCDYVEGRGVILDPHTVEVRAADGSVRQLKAKNILVATGSRAVKLRIPGAEHAITSDEALVLEEVPAAPVVILGAGYIAVEFAGIFRGLGAEVHLMYRAPLPLRHFDEECRAVVAENLQKRGIALHPESHPTRIEPAEGGLFTLHYTDRAGQEQSITAGKVMMATGRRPNSRGIGLEDVGVALDPKSGAIKVGERREVHPAGACGVVVVWRGVVVRGALCLAYRWVDQYSHTNIPSIWAIGDVTDRMNLTPVALMEGKALAATLFGGRPTVPDYDNIPTAVFCQPPLGTVGATEEEAVEKLHGELEIYVSRFKPMRNTLSGRDERTFMKMIVHGPTNRGIGVALKCGATKAQFDSCVGIHPSAAEEWVTMSAPTRRVQGRGQCVEPLGGTCANGYKE
eukprot:scaffold10.g2348.t1